MPREADPRHALRSTAPGNEAPRDLSLPRFWIDRGGTFTDCILLERPGAPLKSTKVLSEDRAPLIGIRKLLELEPQEPIPPCEVRMGTTLATNALLERRGAPCALITSTGFGDVLAIGDQTRASLFSLATERPPPLTIQVVEIDSRGRSQGRAPQRASSSQVKRALESLRKAGIQSLAISLVHGHRHPELEAHVAELAQELGFEQVSLSSEVAPRTGFYARTSTTVLDAYLTPLIRRYMAALQRELPGSQLLVMQSSGGLAPADTIRGHQSLLSGPAGGAVACARVSAREGIPQALGFDMGGTSTDVCRLQLEPGKAPLPLRHESVIASTPVIAPMVDIHTVAAGGGSICRFDSGRFAVGPESAGSHPGPLCYGHADAEELTVTDLNLVLGRLPSDLFPFPLDAERPRRKLHQLKEQLDALGHNYGVEEIAQGFLQVANANMAQAIAEVSVARGHAPKRHALVVFGGAGGQHACAVAEQLDIHQIVFPPLGGVLSALGIGLSDVQRDLFRQLDAQPLGSLAVDQVNQALDELSEEGRAAFAREGVAERELIEQRLVALSYAGSEAILHLPMGAPQQLEAAFAGQHQNEFGYARPGHEIQVRGCRLQLSLPGPSLEALESPVEPSLAHADLPRARTVYPARGAPYQAPSYRRTDLRVGQRLSGPVVLLEASSAILIEPGFEVELQVSGSLVASRTAAPTQAGQEPARTSAPIPDDPIQLELMGNRFMAIAEQMGRVLQRTALSTNIRERRDFSCAVFDAQANLVANAPHIPVHLGAMSESVRAVAKLHPAPNPGDMFVVNDPLMGGSHLPDITVIAPVVSSSGRIDGYVASRGHHADIGGVSPGSMPSGSTSLAEEGVVFRGEALLQDGELQHQLVLQLLSQPPYPARMAQQNLADLEAQVAANHRGQALLRDLNEELGREFVLDSMRALQRHASERVSALIASIAEGRYQFADELDDGTPLRVCIEVKKGEMVIDFSGSGDVHPGNANAPRAVVIAAVLYVLRCLAEGTFPLNEGCLRSVRLVIPEHSLLNPLPTSAVASGNVETAQRIVDILLGALGGAAASQGTMNNLTLGKGDLGYYETLGGGAGAGPNYRGGSAVHTHMTNTRITDVEVFEERLPAELEVFAIRRGSGGAGRFPGGDGLIRQMRFLEPLELSLVTSRRSSSPFGLLGGANGQPGVNLLNGDRLGSRVDCHVQAGDVLRIETPGGGGFGAPPDSE